MPVLNDFKGEKFQFTSPNKIYNILSDPYIQVNAHFDENSNIDLIGFKFGCAHKINYLKLIAKNKKTELNDKPVYSRSYFEVTESNYYGYAEYKYKLESSLFPPAIQFPDMFINYLFIDAGKYHFFAILNRLKKDIYFYNFFSIVKNHSAKPCGIMGQVNNLEDYEVTSLWANDFIYNKFKESRCMK